MRLAVWLAGLLLLVGAGAAQGAIQVEVDGDRVTLKAENAPLQDILQAVAIAGHFTLHLDTPLPGTTSIQFARQPLLDSLDWLLRDHSSLIRSAREQSGVRIEEVWVLVPSGPAGRGDKARPATGTGTGASAEQDSAERRAAQEAEVTERIVGALALAGDDQAETGRAILVDLLETNQEPAARQEALAALIGLDEVPVEPVARAALTDPDWSVQVLALTVLGEMARTDARAAQALEQARLQNPDVELQQVAQALLEGARADNP